MRRKAQTEAITLQKCLKQLRALSPVFRAKLLKAPVLAHDKSRLEFDGRVDTAFKTGDRSIYLAKAINNLSRAQAEQLITWTPALKGNRSAEPMLVMASYVNPRLAELLKQHRVQFVDAVGNAFIDRPKGVFVWVRGNRPDQILPATMSRPAFQTNGCKVVFVLLKHPERTDWTYRRIAEEAHVALGTVSRVIKDLKASGFIETIGPAAFRLTGKRKLFERWVESYSERLRPKLFLGSFRTRQTELSQIADELTSKKTVWALTGDRAADLLTGYLKGGRLVLFLEVGVSEPVGKLKWMASQDGNIEALRLFSRAALFDGVKLAYPTTVRRGEWPVAHPLLVYAELIHSGGDREREAARLIYERYIARLIETA